MTMTKTMKAIALGAVAIWTGLPLGASAAADAAPDGDRNCPLMGWSSWNAFGVDISEDIILDVARAMATNGLKAAGYRYVNIDDGFYAGHGEDGRLRFHPVRFPNGLKKTVDGIHALGLKAGIYSDAGKDTCGSMWVDSGTGGKDASGVGSGLYGHDADDCRLYFNELGFDFIKVDYCGGKKLSLDERERYGEIARAIRATGRADVRLNVCRWAFPGTWISEVADSWRTTADIRANWKSVRTLIDENLYLSAYASPGHYNDMDMLEVGQRTGAITSIFGNHGDTGLTEDEEVAHFGMWCMLSSPLLIGCDVRALPAFTMALVTNPHLIAMNQNRGLGVQGYVAQRLADDAYVLVKDADARFGTSRYVALYNAGESNRVFEVRSDALDLAGKVAAFDLVAQASAGAFEGTLKVEVRPHAARFYRFDAETRLERVAYEAETAFLTDYQELKDPVKAGTAYPAQAAGASGGVAVRGLGGRPSNDLVWKEVRVEKGGLRTLEFTCASDEDRSMTVEVDGQVVARPVVRANAAFRPCAAVTVNLEKGTHVVRLSNPDGRMPDVDVMRVRAPLTTPWGEKVTSENAWREYPRPQLVRKGWTNLNGDWEYAVTSVTNTPGRPEKWDGKIRVPFAIESALSGVGRLLQPDEFLWYTRTVNCAKRPGERILLHFGAVDFRAQVFVGHREVTPVPHEGGQNPWTLDVTDYVTDGANELTVCVWDPTEDFVNSRGKQSFEPKSCYYTRVSGIWQTVWMENVPETRVAGYKATTDIDKGTVTLAFDVRSPKFAKPEVTVEVAGVKGTTTDGVVTLALPKPVRLWSPDAPNLYDFTATCGADAVQGYFGMRKIEKRKDAKGVLRFFLNEEPVFLLGTLDQGWWPDGLLTPPSEEAMAFDVKTLKDCGYNMMRKHIKVEPARYYYLCDKMGILVVQDLPSGEHNWKSPIQAKTTARYWLQRQELREMMDALQTFPSIVMWCPYNEGWTQPGEFLTHATLDFARDYDPTRLVNGPSGCWDWEGGHLLPTGWVPWDKRVTTAHKTAGVCEAADAVDAHLYRGPAMFPVNERRISFLGEFGGLGQPVAGHVWNESRNAVWGYGGKKDTATREGLAKAYVGLLDQVAGLAAQGLGGAVYTQTTDVEIEINGLLTYDRKVLKFDPAVLKAVHEKVYRAAQDAAAKQ